MTSALADTLSIIWYLSDQTQLSAAALQTLRAAERDHRLFVSAITLAEVRLEVEAGRLPREVWEGLREATLRPQRPLVVLPVDAIVVEALGQAASTNCSNMTGRIVAATAVAHDLPVVRTAAGSGGVTLAEAVRTAERAAIQAALNQCDQHRERAANVLGISVRTLHYKLSEGL